jgi:CheY-like chemotaxis protein
MDPINILLVDDSKSARYALRLQLQRHGVLVDTADSAESALERIGEKPPDAVLMDHTMPGMNGFEALDIIKSDLATAHIPVVMCTSHDDPAYAAQALKRGALTVLSKAAAVDKLAEVLAQVQHALSAQVKVPAPAPAAPPSDAIAAPVHQPVPGPTLAEVESWVAAYLTQHLAETIEPHLSRLNTHLRQVIAEQVEMAVDALPPPLPPAAPAPVPPPAPVIQTPAIDVDELRDKIVPAAVRRHFDMERDGILQLMQQCFQETQSQRGEDTDTLPKLLETVEDKMADRVTQIAAREAEAAVRAALARDGGALAAVQRGLRLSYGLGVTAIVAAACVAVAVYVLLK